MEDYRTDERKKEELDYIRIGKCSNCGKCCRGIFSSQAKGLNVKMLSKVFNNILNNNGSCKFHSRRLRRCMIYSNRPEYCKDYPAVPSDLISGCSYSFKKKS